MIEILSPYVITTAMRSQIEAMFEKDRSLLHIIVEEIRSVNADLFGCEHIDPLAYTHADIDTLARILETFIQTRVTYKESSFFTPPFTTILHAIIKKSVEMSKNEKMSVFV